MLCYFVAYPFFAKFGKVELVVVELNDFVASVSLS